MVLHNPNNWHWVNKDVSGWTREYLDKELIGLSTEKDGNSAEISKVLSMEGDVDVSQRKGKVITIFDVRLQLEYIGKVKVKSKTEGEEEGTDTKEVSGTVTIPEVAHDTEEDEYVFEVEIYSEDASKQPVKDLVKRELTAQIRKKLQKLAPALIEAHGKDLQHAPGSNPSSGFSTPRTLQSSSVGAKKSDTSSSTTATSTSGSNVNVTTLSDTQEFRTTAAQLYQTFTDPQRITAFTRGPPKLFEGSSEGSKFEIFGGNVSGSFTKLTEPTYIEQKWRLAQWPQGHFSTMKIKFEQNDVDAVTIMRVDWVGVPVGHEEATKRNWDEYYVRSIKQTFGFGTIL
ncbi:hypothetical protein B0A48_01694 [Cryoendolithus antarcticus]|uniref:Activator of Hsp90 ATPase AHSA1-like N-terminal domain-containing protein n=1 Tax=Cryoendolithus antarcticus TaxID=1507870 RepID=A0A1V8TQ08_9PEZI|nr:hypothetical protein B0A48_01694 [Cryoendolithus antarcticus]